jgi:hypothetical protein
MFALLGLLVACKTDLGGDREWVKSLTKLESAISMQFLRMEVMRDEVELTGRIQACDPELVRDAYDSASSQLLALSQHVPERNRAEILARLKVIESAWSLARERHRARWLESKDLPNVPPSERCLRASDVAASRMTVEQNIGVIFEMAL